MKLPRFILRDLFWLVLACAIGLGWWLEHMLLCNRMQTLKRVYPMLYETMTGEEVQTNRLKRETAGWVP
jgi:hypothetical protein